MKRAFILFTLLIGFLVSAQSETLFERANTSYNEGNYVDALADYEKILDEDVHSAELYFNMGNACYKLNQIAPSIYYYEKALLLKPNDTEIKSNLAYAQNMTLDAIDTSPEVGLAKFYKDITAWLTFDQWAYTAVLCMLLFVFLYIAFSYFSYSTRKRIAFISSLACLFISLVSVAFAFVQYNDFEADKPAIIFSSEVTVQSDPNNTGQKVFRLHEGTKVSVLEEYNDFHKIQIADGKTGWVPKESLKLLKDF